MIHHSNSILSVNNRPWWTFGHLWLVLSGPIVVIIAGLVTVYISFAYKDTVVNSRELNKSHKVVRSFSPALQGRNNLTAPVPEQK
jgi:hypothetical protein